MGSGFGGTHNDIGRFEDSPDSEYRCLALKLSRLCKLIGCLNKHQETFCSANQVIIYTITILEH
jgi:hypothetical protein